jgi:hypothetical protein
MACLWRREVCSDVTVFGVLFRVRPFVGLLCLKLSLTTTHYYTSIGKTVLLNSNLNHFITNYILPANLKWLHNSEHILAERCIKQLYVQTLDQAMIMMRILYDVF